MKKMIMMGTIIVGVVLMLFIGWRVIQLRTTSPVAQVGPVGDSAETASVVTAALHAEAVAVEPVVLGHVITQTFTLTGGWNSIYLEVEPINPSPLVDPDGDGPLLPTHSEASLPAIFAKLTCIACLEGVWSWHVPASRMEYIVDPAETGWDAAGWDRYFPATDTGPDGLSTAFLSTLVTLHAHTAYLVKLKEGSGPVTLVVAGTVRAGQRHWALDSYNLVGFPSPASGGPTVAMLKSSSTISDVLQLTSVGEWERLPDNTRLTPQRGYLVYYATPNGSATAYTAPLAVEGGMDGATLSGLGLRFARKLAGTQAELTVANLTNSPVTVELSLLSPSLTANPTTGIALRYFTDNSNSVRLDQTPNATFTLQGRSDVLTSLRKLKFQVRAAEQQRSGEGIVQIAAPALGVRWLIPVTAESGSMAGLWVGDVVVNDVSESRLGSTNVANGALTVALNPTGANGLQGLVQMQEVNASLTLTAAIVLPDAKVTTPLVPLTNTTGVVLGYLFSDLNQNGQRDGDEPGLSGLQVRLTRIGTINTLVTTSATDGAYRFTNLTDGAYSLATTTPAGYTANFPVLLPAATQAVANSLPTELMLSNNGLLSSVSPPTYKTQAVGARALPMQDANGQPLPVWLNFGYVRTYALTLNEQKCGGSAGGATVFQGTLVNGALQASGLNATLNPPAGVSTATQLLGAGKNYALHITAADQGEVACGDIGVGAPTTFSDGTGSTFRYRVLLRVAADGSVALLPSYVVTDGLQISAPAFSMTGPITRTGATRFGYAANGALPSLDFRITIAANDPLNPFKHKYHPDHDNLDAKFNPFPASLSPYAWEAFDVQRRLTLTLSPTPSGGSIEDAQTLDWGGLLWGGSYQEVLTGLHKNAITVKGYFVIRQILTADQMRRQDYDQ